MGNMKDTRIVIIDDEKENVRYLTTILEENGFLDIQCAYDGVEGLAKVKEVAPGLVLLDLRMPRKSGIFVFNEMKKSPTLKEIPVIILTGEEGFLRHLAELRDFHEDREGLEDIATEEVLNRFIETRPDAFIEKPIEPEAFLAAVRRVMITLDGIKDKRRSELKALRDRRIEGGVTFRGTSFPSDERTRNLLSALAVRITTGGAPAPERYVWQSSGNKEVSMTKEDILAFNAALTDWVYAHHRTCWDHMARIDALTVIEDVEYYRIDQGWPDDTI